MSAVNLGMPRSRDTDWRAEAACLQTDPDIFSSDHWRDIERAKNYCNTKCDVREQCLKYALDNDEQYSVWGGMNVRERKQLKRGAA